jgi:PGF-CTERM protein
VRRSRSQPLRNRRSDSYSPVEAAELQGYTQSLTVDLDDAVITVTTAFSHESEAAVDEDVLSAVGSETGESTLSRDGRFVTVESTYPDVVPDDAGDGTDDGGMDDGGGDDGGMDDGGGDDDGMDDGGGDDGGMDDGTGDGSDDGGGDDGSDGGGDDGTDDDGGGGDGADGGSDDGTDEGSEDGSDGDGDGSGDGLGPGFGLPSALAGIGGAGYLLSRRLGRATGQDDGEQ